MTKTLACDRMNRTGKHCELVQHFILLASEHFALSILTDWLRYLASFLSSNINLLF